MSSGGHFNRQIPRERLGVVRQLTFSPRPSWRYSTPAHQRIYHSPNVREQFLARPVKPSPPPRVPIGSNFPQKRNLNFESPWNGSQPPSKKACHTASSSYQSPKPSTSQSSHQEPQSSSFGSEFNDQKTPVSVPPCEQSPQKVNKADQTIKDIMLSVVESGSENVAAKFVETLSAVIMDVGSNNRQLKFPCLSLLLHLGSLSTRPNGSTTNSKPADESADTVDVGVQTAYFTPDRTASWTKQLRSVDLRTILTFKDRMCLYKKIFTGSIYHDIDSTSEEEETEVIKVKTEKPSMCKLEEKCPPP